MHTNTNTNTTNNTSNNINSNNLGSIIAETIRRAERYADKIQKANLPDEDQAELVGLYLETIQNLRDMGESAEPISLSESIVAQSLALLDAYDLSDAADFLVDTVHEVLDSPEDEERLMVARHHAIEKLLIRDRFAKRLQGAKLLYPHLSLADEQQRATEYFDSCIRPIVWGLAFINRAREGALLLVLPQNRKKYWWWYEGVDIKWSTIVSMAETAMLMCRYPSFSRHLAYLREDAVLAEKARNLPPDPEPT